jgi:hypothetical protein
MSDPQSILDPEFVDVTLCGRVYRWKQPCARDVRAWVSELGIISRMVQQDPVMLYEACNKVLDFFYAHHKEMAKDRAALDSATTAEIMKAKREVEQLIAGPLKRMNEGLDELAADILAQQNSNGEKLQPSNS